MSETEQINRFMNFITGSEQDFYETYLRNLSDEEMELFLKNNPDFLVSLKKEENKKTAD